MPILSPPPLPVERFEEFKCFALILDPAGWANATGIALSIQHMLGIAVVVLNVIVYAWVWRRRRHTRATERAAKRR